MNTSKENEAVAQLLGKEPHPFLSLSDPVIRDTVVQKLGEEYGISIVIEPAMGYWIWQMNDEYSDENYYKYSDAIQAAVIAVTCPVCGALRRPDNTGVDSVIPVNICGICYHPMDEVIGSVGTPKDD